MNRDETIARPRALLIASAMLAAVTIYAALRTHGLMGNFRELLNALGSELPPLTQLVLDAPNFWWLIAIPANAVFIWIAARARVTVAERRRMRNALISTLIFGVLVYGLVAYALYGPMFKLDAVV
jgi:hypothetical protein